MTYLLESSYYTDYTHVIMGSANATDAALTHGKNIEMLVELTGKKKDVGGIEDLLGQDGIREFLVDFSEAEALETDEEKIKAEQLLEQARSKFISADLLLHCEPGSDADLWFLRLTGERDSAILKTIISNREQFFRYLLLLLGEDSDAAFLSGIGSGNQGWLAKLLKGENLALLEDLTRTYSRHPERLSDIASLIDDLTRDSGNTVIPENFIELWRIFESAMGEKNA